MFSRNDDSRDYFKVSNYEQLFSRITTRKHWRNLHTDILEAIFKNAQSDRFAQPNEGIEVLKHFIFVSEEYNLVEELFARLSSIAHNTDDFLMYFSFHLYQLGSELTKKCFYAKTQEEIEGYGMPADMAFMASILCDEFNLPAYAGMAIMHGEIVENINIGIEFCAKYKAAIDKLLKTPANELSPLHLSKKESLLDPESFNERIKMLEKDAPYLFPKNLSMDDDEMPQGDYIEQLEKRLKSRLAQ